MSKKKKNGLVGEFSLKLEIPPPYHQNYRRIERRYEKLEKDLGSKEKAKKTMLMELFEKGLLIAMQLLFFSNIALYTEILFNVLYTF